AIVEEGELAVLEDARIAAAADVDRQRRIAQLVGRLGDGKNGAAWIGQQLAHVAVVVPEQAKPILRREALRGRVLKLIELHFNRGSGRPHARQNAGAERPRRPRRARRCDRPGSTAHGTRRRGSLGVRQKFGVTVRVPCSKISSLNDSGKLWNGPGLEPEPGPDAGARTRTEPDARRRAGARAGRRSPAPVAGARRPRAS